ncbi:MAG: hypothetical protein HC919_10995 [Oscillatoriales cyanobacterium SM2_2_1]|nr:hypothetical protein [Oscillatoriales cyanobacterium SM2_2_1]
MTPASSLLFNGSIVLLIGLLSGVPYGIAIVKKQSEEVIRAWKLAHGALSLGATTMIAMAGAFSILRSADNLLWAIAIPYIISGYGFCFALTLEPFTGDRGLAWTGTNLNKLVFIGNVLGSSSSLVGTLVLVCASYMSL